VLRHEHVGPEVEPVGRAGAIDGVDRPGTGAAPREEGPPAEARERQGMGVPGFIISPASFILASHTVRSGSFPHEGSLAHDGRRHAAASPHSHWDVAMCRKPRQTRMGTMTAAGGTGGSCHQWEGPRTPGEDSPPAISALSALG